ncbi:hypothetical protein [Dongia sp.]|uniref:hypothetical protein n=1 Tax=Dongia sp. TaxID=1977262 RepID=UPI0035AFAA84
MKLLLRRNQKSGMLSSSITFTLDARAELADAESEAVKKYKMGKTMLYQKMELKDPGSGLMGLASRLAFKMMNITVTVDELVSGKHIECKDIIEMRAVEEQIKEACENFKAILDTAAHFGGEEVLEI